MLCSWLCGPRVKVVESISGLIALSWRRYISASVISSRTQIIGAATVKKIAAGIFEIRIRNKKQRSSKQQPICGCKSRLSKAAHNVCIPSLARARDQLQQQQQRQYI